MANRAELDKRNVNILRKYTRHFDIKEPYQIIVGPYFCQNAADRGILLKDSISAVFLQRECQLYTTRCCIMELQKQIDRGQSKFIRGAHIWMSYAVDEGPEYDFG